MPDGTLVAVPSFPQAIALDKNALVNRIGLLIVTDPDVNAAAWERYALIVRYGEPGIARRISGFRYHDDGTSDAATPHADALGDALDALREATRVAGKAPWGACIFRIWRETRQVAVEFEYDDPGRWDITPETLADITARARPE